MNIVLYGDSTLARLNKELVLNLEKATPGSIFYNCSTSGFDTNDGLKRSEFISTLPADVFVLCFGLNDGAPWKQVDLPDFKNNINEIIRILGSQRTVFLLPPLVDESKQTEGHRRDNVTLMNYLATTKEIAELNGCKYIDINPALTATGTEVHVDDGVHLNDLGNEVLVKVVSSILM
mgnify:CR=1 FL=1